MQDRKALQALACERAGYAVKLEPWVSISRVRALPADPVVDRFLRLEQLAGQERRCRMTFLLSGEPKMNDWRTFRMDPGDLALVRSNFAAETDLLPLLYDHGWSGRGTLGAGHMVSMPDDTPNLDVVGELTPLAWQEAVVEGAWMYRSLGFYAWWDKNDFMHPVAAVEGSFTSLPAMAGLGPLVPMSELQRRFDAFVSRREIVDLGARTPAPAEPEPAQNSQKEDANVFTPAMLAQLGLKPGATPQEIEAAVAVKLASPAPPPAPSPAPAPAAVGLSETDVARIVTQALDARDARAVGEVRASKVQEAITAAVERGALPSGDGQDAVAFRQTFADIGEKSGLATLQTVLSTLPVKFRVGKLGTQIRSAGDAPRMSRFQELTGKPDSREVMREARAVLETQCGEVSAVLQFARAHQIPERLAKKHVLGVA